MGRILKYGIGFLVAFLVTMLILEGYVYTSGASRKSEVYFNDSFGKAYQPQYDYIWFSEGFSMGSVNEGGYLGPFYTEEKPDSVKRIVLLGDSYVEGFQVFDRNHFRNHLERNLNLVHFDSVEVLNFGRSNFNFPNMYAYSQLLAQKYNPDLYIYFVSREDLNSLTTDVLLPNVSPTNLEVVPFLGDATLSKFQKANTVLRHSSLAYMANSARRMIQDKGLSFVVFEGKFSKQTPISFEEKQIQSINEKLFDKLDKSRILFVYREKEPMPTAMRMKIKKAGIPLLDLSHRLQMLELMGQNPNGWFNQNGDGHWNIEGHRYVGELLASSVSELID